MNIINSKSWKTDFYIIKTDLINRYEFIKIDVDTPAERCIALFDNVKLLKRRFVLRHALE